MPFLRYKAAFIIFTFMLAANIELSWATVEHWKEELKGDHFIVYYAGEEEFPKAVLRKAESYYKQISADLGYQRYSDFWQWDKRVKIYIYPTWKEFLMATRQPPWSHGVADYTRKEIRSYFWGEGFLESLLPHEMTHLIFRDYVGFKGEVPLWIDEGVAQWEEPEKRAVVRQAMEQMFQAKKQFSLTDLTKMDVREGADTETASLFYIQAASVVHFLVTQYGADDFIIFCRQLRDGKSLVEALQFTYPTSMRNLNEMEERWRKFILRDSR